jgi:two-component system response regulator GlrR
VVDDDPSVLRLITTTLERAGYRVQAATSAEDALRLHAAQRGDPFRLLLSDVVMPAVSGVELARRLTKCDPGVYVLLMSGHGCTLAQNPELAGQPYELLTKPFPPEGLLRAVRSALARATPRPGTAPLIGPRRLET